MAIREFLNRMSLWMLAGCLLLGLPAVQGCKGEAPSVPAGRTVAAATQPAAARQVVECRSFPAQVEARNSVTLASKLSGTVVAVMAQEGAALHGGDPILQIDDKDLLSRDHGLAASMNQAAMERQAAAAKADHARTTVDRLGRLLAQKVISQEDFDKARTEYLAQKREEEAIAAREQAVAAQREELKALKAYTRISAPFDGILARRFVDLGAFVSAGQPLALVDDQSSGFDLTAQVDESLLSAIRVGQPLLGVIPAMGKEPFASKITAVVGRVDPASRTFKLKADIPAATGENASKPNAGMFGRVFLPVRVATKLLAPAACVRMRGDLPSVFVVDGKGVVHFRVVKTGGVFLMVGLEGQLYLTDSEAFEDTRSERYVEILTGVSDGEQLVCEKTETLREGDRIAPGAAPAATTAPTGGKQP